MLSLGEVGLVRAQLQTPTQPKATYGNDITAAYLVEATSFSDNGETTRFRSPEYWTVENFEIDEGSNGKKGGIDNNPGFNCLQLGRYTESESAYAGFDLQNSRLYLKVTLSAGKYYFGAKYHSRSSGHDNVTDTYFFVSTTLMATSAVESNALACMRMKDAKNDGAFYGITFELTAETEVYLGWQQNSTTQKTEFRCSEVTLRKYTGLPTQSALEGWTYVDGTTVTLTDLDNYYYLFLDAVEANKSLAYSGIGTDARPVYQLLQDPTKSIGQVWKLENTTNDRIRLKAYANDWYYSANGNGWDSYMGTSTNYEKHYFTLNDGAYNLKVKWSDYMALGAWSDFSLSGNGLGYAGTAGNKTVGSKEDHGFFIYRIPRANFTPAPQASENYAAAGWKEVTSTEDWGRDGRHYVFLDVSETGFETNMAMTATTGRPQYQFSDMSNPSQKWMTEPYDGGYALKDVSSGKYTSYTSATDATLYDDTNHSGIKFTPTLTNGKWAIFNAKDTSHFLGRWGDSDNGKSGKNDPFAGEEIPANKSADNGKRLFAIYAIPAVVGAAEALPANGDMAANTWYYFDINNAGNSYSATATSLANIECISYETSAAVTLSATGNALTNTRYYVKSTIVNNLVVSIADMTEIVEQARERWHNQYDAIVNQALDKSAFDTVLENAANVTSEAELAAYDATVWQAVCDVLQASTNASVQFDLTSLITNPNLDSNTNGWNITGDVRYSSYGLADFFNQSNASFTQTLTDMPAGTYILKAQSSYRSRAWRDAVAAYQHGVDEVKGNLVLGDATIPVCNIYDQPRFQPARLEGNIGGSRQRMVSDSKTTTAAAFGIGQYWNQLTHTTTADGDLTIGVNIVNGLSDNWFCYDNFRLYYGATAIPVDLTQGMPTEDTQATTVNTGITLNSGTYNKVCLPFDLNATQTATAFAAAYTLAGVTAEGVGQLVPVSTIEAGKAYFVTVDATKTLTVNDVMVRVAQPDSIPVIWEGAATVGTFDGFTFTVNRTDGVTAEPTYTPVDMQNMSFTVNQENWRARRFLNEFTYLEDRSVHTKIDAYNVGKPAPLDHPHSVFIPVPQNSSAFTISVSQESDYSDAETFAFAAGTTLCEVPNLVPQSTYYYKVEAGGSVLTKGQFQTIGHLRMIKTITGFNMRDLGGWETIDGNRIRYGKIFRGGELNIGHTVSATDLAEMQRLGMGAELDFRRDGDCNNTSPTSSVLTNDTEHYLYLNQGYGSTSNYYLVDKELYKNAFYFTLDNLRDDKAVYFHCRIGADRTGAYGMLVEGLCGATFDQICKDYELTSYSEADTREWDGSGQNLIEKLDYIEAMPGTTLQKKFFYYMNHELEIPTSDLFDFINIMVDGESSLMNSDLAFNNANNEYHQSLSDVTAICAYGSTIVSGAKAQLSDGTHTTDVTMTADGITISFEAIALETGKTYTLTIPFHAVEKDGVGNAQALSLTINTPLVFDGDYYLYNEAQDQFLSRNRNYGTRGVLDNFGIPATFTTDKSNITTIKFLDNELYYGDQDGYTDKGTGDAIKWTLEPTTNNNFLLFLNNGVNKYVTMAYDNDYKYWFNRLRTKAEATPTPFKVKTLAEYNEIKAGKLEANILAAASAAGISASDLNEFQAALGNYTPTLLSGVIKSADAGNKSDWVIYEPWARNESGNGYNIGDYGAEFYLKNASVSQTVTVPRAGLYKLTLNAFLREGTNERCFAAGEKGFVLSNAYVSINDTYYAQVSDWYSDRRTSTSPNSTNSAKELMDAGKYAMEVYAYIGDAKTATITLTVPGYSPNQWCIFNHWALTEYVPNVTLSETADVVPQACDYANVTLHRSMVAKTSIESGNAWNTICFPFALNSDQITATFGSGTLVKELSDVNITGDKASLTFVDVTTIEANKPYIMQVETGGTEYTIPGVAITPSTDLTVEKSGLQFIGNYVCPTVLANTDGTDYYILNDAFKSSKGNTNLKGFRAYFHVPDTSPVKSLGFDEGESTGISSMNNEELRMNNDEVYDLSGRRVTAPSKGFYIINGKKVFLK